MKDKILTVMMFGLVFVAGGFVGSIMEIAPNVESNARLHDKLRHNIQLTQEYRRQCEEWSHYVWKLENLQTTERGINLD